MSHDDLQLTPKEAEEILRRFREEEEELQRRMEDRATNPTVADLAEGLGVPQDRIVRLLSEVRSQPAPLKSSSQEGITQERAQSNHQTAWIVAVIVLGVMFMALVFGLASSSRTSNQVPPPPVSQQIPSDQAR